MGRGDVTRQWQGAQAATDIMNFKKGLSIPKPKILAMSLTDQLMHNKTTVIS